MTLLIIILFAAAAPSARANSPAANPERYVLPLLGPYGVERTNLQTAYNDYNHFVLVERSSPTANSWTRLVHSLKRVAVQPPLILGDTVDGYFILDTAARNPQPITFKTDAEFHAALAARGVTQTVPFASPDTLAASLPNRTVRPWQYRRANARFGLTDEDLGGAIVIGGWILCFLLGLFHKRRRAFLFPAAALIGTLTNFVGRIALGEGGGPAGVGLVFEPLWCCACAGVGYVFGSPFRPRPAPPAQGFPIEPSPIRPVLPAEGTTETGA